MSEGQSMLRKVLVGGLFLLLFAGLLVVYLVVLDWAAGVILAPFHVYWGFKQTLALLVLFMALAGPYATAGWRRKQ